MTDEEKLKDAMESFAIFINNLDGPNDIYKQILVITLFEELYGYKLETEFQE